MRLRDLLILAFLITLLFGTFLGSRPLSVPDEGRYVEIPREMVETGDWLTPRLNGVKYFEKPPLVYWFEAFLIKFFGLSEWSVRIGPAVFALFGCLVVYGAASRLFGRRAGLLSAMVLATSMLYFALSRLVALDMPVTALLTAALLSFLAGTKEPEGGARRSYFYGFYGFAALATLTKGLIGIILPGMIIAAWLLVMNNWRMLRTIHLVTGTALFFLIAAPWHALMAATHREFVDLYFVQEHFLRYLTTMHNRYKPFWFFAPILFAGLFPWSAFLIQAIRRSLPPSWRDRQAHGETIFLLLWAAVVFLFFSASGSKLIPYILPMLPPLAILIGSYLAEAWDGTARGFRGGVIAFAVFGMILGAALLAFPRYRPELIPPGLRPELYVRALIPLGAGALALFINGKRSARQVITGIMIAAAVLFLSLDSLTPHLDHKSVKNMALELKQRLRPGDEVACYQTYYRDLQVYIEKRLTLVDWTGELKAGMAGEDASGWMINEAELRKRWKGTGTIYLVTERRMYDTVVKNLGRSSTIIAENRDALILVNK